MIKKYHVSEQHGNTWNPKSYVKFISGTQTYNKFPIVLRTTQQSIPTWSVKGNMVQNGVPSSTTPITPSECGERTGNLFDYTKTDGIIANKYIKQSGDMVTNNEYYISYPIKVNVGETYTWRFNSDSVLTTHSAPTVGFYDSSDNLLSTAQHNVSVKYFSFEVPVNCAYIRASVFIRSNAQKRAMLNLGSTPLPYEPYGYKLDIKSDNTTTPVYLGQVQSTRRIKKLVLTGGNDENWNITNNSRVLYLAVSDFLKEQGRICYCTHYETVNNVSSADDVNDGDCTFNDHLNWLYIKDSNYTSAQGFKNYLAAQYAAGTPVTVWYVLANETTGVVNEPLRKIGDYVDSITNPVSLPTTLGLNTIDVNTTLKPSEMSLTYNGYKVCKSTKIQQVTREVDFVNNTKSLTGSVDNLKVYQLMNRCNVSDNGTITAYYGDPNYTEDGSNGQVMVYVKKFYYKLDVSQTGDLDGINIRKGRWSISDIPIEGYKLHPAFLAADGVTELPYFLYGAFDAVGQDSNGIYSSSYNTTSYKLSSVGGNTYKPICSLTRATARTMATNRGNGWYPVGVKQTMAIQMLFSVEFGFNSQIAVGRGIVNDTGTHNTGLTIGNKTSGTYDNATTAVNYRGIENLWGNICNFIDGINISNTTPYICNTFTFSDNTSTNYSRISFTLPGINYTTAFGYDSNNDWVLLPSETNRSTVDEFGPIGDYFGSNSDWRVARLGGSYIYGRDAGLFYWDCHYNSSYTDVGVGVRLMYIPQTT